MWFEEYTLCDLEAVNNMLDIDNFIYPHCSVSSIIDIDDIFHCLVKIPNFGGHCFMNEKGYFPSLGLHSLYIYYVLKNYTLDPNVRMAGLLYYANKAYDGKVSNDTIWYNKIGIRKLNEKEYAILKVVDEVCMKLGHYGFTQEPMNSRIVFKDVFECYTSTLHIPDELCKQIPSTVFTLDRLQDIYDELYNVIPFYKR